MVSFFIYQPIKRFCAVKQLYIKSYLYRFYNLRKKVGDVNNCVVYRLYIHKNSVLNCTITLKCVAMHDNFFCFVFGYEQMLFQTYPNVLHLHQPKLQYSQYILARYLKVIGFIV